VCRAKKTETNRSIHLTKLNNQTHKQTNKKKKNPKPFDPHSDGHLAPEQMRYPLSLGPPRDTVDKQGRRARVVDVIFSPETVAMAARDAATRDFVVEVAFSAFEQKNNESICRAPQLSGAGMGSLGVLVSNNSFADF
jgi:hypothetical protein